MPDASIGPKRPVQSKKNGMLQNHFGSTEGPGFRKEKELPKLYIQLFNLIFLYGFRYKDASKCVHLK